MGFLFTGVFWGLVLILFGVAVVIKAVFHIHIPILRILFALILIYTGIQLLVGGCFWKGTCNRNTIMFSEGQMSATPDNNDYSVIFGNGRIDLSDIAVTDKDVLVEVNAIFGNALVFVNPNVPTIIKGSAAFGNTVLPDGNSIAFGNREHKSAAYSDSGARLIIRANAVFGKVEIMNKQVEKRD
jgi:predicted membrane protein